MVGDEAIPEEGVNNNESGEKKAPNVGRQGCEVKKLRRVVKWVAGARKVWGRKSLVMRLQERWLRWGGRWNLATLYRSKQVGQMNGKDGWWFVVKAPEKNLLKLDKVWQHKYWWWQRIHGGRNDSLGWDLCQLGTGECLLLIGGGHGGRRGWRRS